MLTVGGARVANLGEHISNESACYQTWGLGESDSLGATLMKEEVRDFCD